MNSAEQYRDDAFEQIVKIGKSLGNISRLKILDNLVQSRKSVEELASAVGLSVGTTSKNLQLLKKVGLVKEEKEKNFVFYKLASQKVAKVISLLIDISEENIPELQELEHKLKTKNSNIRSITVPDLKKQLYTKDPYLLDLRPSEEYQMGHLPGAHNIPYNQIEKRMDEIPRDREVIVYCRGRLCGYSDIIGGKLSLAGYRVKAFNNTVWEWNHSLEK
ncbi:metalloregulator ArsR/SmtB family transcription factor [Lactobacillus hamsteri]|uniref:Transcriptional regulator n=1 Tax=Lactobacillus hamsteri DSM 5661 = JCM 6256 TaxID=1423754 RepID=A0A0R1YKS8_9LACO|nr:metalloregulator ArsR/SmtB family transcription factor [Lactobacillus hamsteri]KRM40555.1 transcriptional regulator [Lactobacillus hamsteri DSM 5661 = JCM 6256]